MINKNVVVLLTDDNTTAIGKSLFQHLEKIFSTNGYTTYSRNISKSEHGIEILNHFDEIAIDLCPEYLIVADMACIDLQSMEEDPLYNNWTSRITHILFRHPWEYQNALNFRCNFTTEIIASTKSDIDYIREFHSHNINISSLENYFDDAIYIPTLVWQSIDNCVNDIMSKPQYLKKISTDWLDRIICDNNTPPIVHLKNYLREIGFECTNKEFSEVLSMISSVVAIADFQTKDIPSDIEWNSKELQNPLVKLTKNITDNTKSYSLLNHLF